MMMRTCSASVLRKRNATVPANCFPVKVLEPARRGVNNVAGRVDVVSIVARIGERLAGLDREPDDQSRCKKELHLPQ
jgi:hypothetical protein